MEISIIIPVYNVEKYIRKCLESIYSLTSLNKEIIIIDDGSTDGSLKVINEFKQLYPNETKVIVQNNKGLSASRNKGIVESSGEYLYFIDGDDFIDSEKFMKLFHYCKENDLDIGLGEYKYYSNNKEVFTAEIRNRLEKFKEFEILDGVEFLERTYNKKKDFIRVEVPINLYKRSLIVENNVLFKEGLLHEDTLFTYQLMLFAKKVKYYPCDFYFYRTREGSIMNSLGYKNYMHKIYIAKKLQQLKEEFDVNKSSWDNLIFSLYFSAVKNYKIKNTELYNEIKRNKKLSFKNKIKKILLYYYGIGSEEKCIILD